MVSRYHPDLSVLSGTDLCMASNGAIRHGLPARVSLQPATSRSYSTRVRRWFLSLANSLEPSYASTRPLQRLLFIPGKQLSSYSPFVIAYFKRTKNPCISGA
jgi:hypothetical protein